MFGLMGVARMAGQPGGAFSPASLFSGGEQGAWYDPSDFASMFQDSAGTTPVTAVEQPVGLLLDKRFGLARGAETNPEPYSGSASGTWAISADQVTRNGSAGGQASLTLNAAFAGRVVKLTFTVAGFSGDSFYVRVGGGTSIGPISADGDYVCYPLAGAALTLAIAPWVGSTGEATISNISVREIAGNHATQSTAAARSVLRQDEGGKYYLEFDGVDDFLATAAIDFSASDEMTAVVALERPDTSTLMVAELSSNLNSNAGSFFVVSGPNDGGFYSCKSRGDAFGSSATWAADNGAEKAIITGTHDISGDLSRIRRNGVYGIDGIVDKGAGNFGNYPIYIGSRGGASLFFNGGIYGLLVIDRVLTADELAATEAYFAANAGVTL